VKLDCDERFVNYRFVRGDPSIQQSTVKPQLSPGPNPLVILRSPSTRFRSLRTGSATKDLRMRRSRAAGSSVRKRGHWRGGNPVGRNDLLTVPPAAVQPEKSEPRQVARRHAEGQRRPARVTRLENRIDRQERRPVADRTRGSGDQEDCVGIRTIVLSAQCAVLRRKLLPLSTND